MPTTPSIGGLIAVSEDSGIKALGYLTWFSVPDESIGLRKLKSQLAVQGLPPTLAPKDTKAIHTFKRAMREQEGRRRQGDIITDTAVAQVTETAWECVYQIARVKRDLEDQVVDYPKALRVTFVKADEEIKFKPLGEVPRADALEMMSDIQDFYDKNNTKVTGARVRGIVRNYLRSEPDEQRTIDGLGGENLRGKAGGIYFIPAEHVEQLKALSSMLEELYPGRAYLHAVPMADGASQREIIRRHHIANTRQEIMEAIGEAKSLLSADRERALRSDVVANKWAQFRQIQRRAARYNELLKDEQDEITDAATILNKQLDRLLGA
jgi:hypothetical protein